MSSHSSTSTHDAFATALVGSSQNIGGKILNEKGCPVERDTGVPGVDAFHKLVRDETLSTKSGSILAQRRGAQGSAKRGGVPDLETDVGRQLVESYVQDMLADAESRLVSQQDPTELIRTFIMPFLKRRTTRSSNTGEDGKGAKKQTGGEGERLLFRQIYIELYKKYPQTMRDLLPLVPHYGCFKDLFDIWKLWQRRLSDKVSDTPSMCLDFQCAVLHLVWKHLMDDKKAFSKDGPNAECSLAAKWVPREAKTVRKDNKKVNRQNKDCYMKVQATGGVYIGLTAYQAIAKMFHMRYGGDTSESYKSLKSLLTTSTSDGSMKYACRLFRQNYIIPLRTHLDIVEKRMCSNQWSGIAPEKVPSRAQHKYSRAFLDEDRAGVRRHPDDEDRQKCREAFLEALVDPEKIKTAGVDPHEILKEFMATTSTAQREIKRVAWQKKVDEVYESILDRVRELDESGADIPQHLGNLIGMADVSGSMNGQPMDVSIALTLFLAAIQEKAGYTPLAISFTDVPMAFDFTAKTLEQRVQMIQTHIGFATDFGKAMDLVLDTIRKTGRHMDMVVFTDEQFDRQYNCGQSNSYSYNYSSHNGRKASDVWKTFHQGYLTKVAQMGLVTVPRVIYWNLRAHTAGAHTDANHPGVQMLQGYNLNNLRFVLFADGASEETEVNVEVTDEATGQTVIRKVKTTNVTPYDTYCAAMNDEAFDPVREIIYNSNENLLRLITRPIDAPPTQQDVVSAVDSTTRVPEPAAAAASSITDVDLVEEIRSLRQEIADLRSERDSAAATAAPAVDPSMLAQVMAMMSSFTGSAQQPSRNSTSANNSNRSHSSRSTRNGR